MLLIVGSLGFSIRAKIKVFRMTGADLFLVALRDSSILKRKIVDAVLIDLVLSRTARFNINKMVFVISSLWSMNSVYVSQMSERTANAASLSSFECFPSFSASLAHNSTQ